MGGIAGAVGAFVVFPIDLVSPIIVGEILADLFRSKLESRINGLTLLERYCTRIPGIVPKLSTDMKVCAEYSTMRQY
jgi:hypothetical protein